MKSRTYLMCVSDQNDHHLRKTKQGELYMGSSENILYSRRQIRVTEWSDRENLDTGKPQRCSIGVDESKAEISDPQPTGHT